MGKGYVISHPDDLLVFEYDGSIDKAVPQAVVFPVSMEEVRRVVAVAQEFDVAVVGRGSGTGLSGGAIASAGGLQVALTRMNRILEMDVENRLAVVEPGVINLQLDEAARKHGLRYAPDPSSQRACSIGGNVAENAGGPHCLAYGVTTNHILGAEAVLPNGDIVWLGGPTQDRPGYDLTGLFVGSEGTMGIATKVLVRLTQNPEAVRTLLAIFDDVSQASRAVSNIIAAGIIPAALEMIDKVTMSAVSQAVDGADYPPEAGAVLLIEVDGLRESVAAEAASVEEVCKGLAAREIRSAERPEDRERLWAGRKGALGALGRLAPNYYILDGVVPRSKLPEVLARVLEICERHRFRVANVFHAGDGNLHPNVLFDERVPGESERVLLAGEEIMRVCVEVGGSITGEHGVGLEKKSFMPLIFSADDMAAMEKVKAAFYATENFNPCKVLPTGRGCGEASRHPMRAAMGAEAVL